MANRFKKCSICGKRKRATILAITPSPYKINSQAEICVEVCPQSPTKICNACFHKLSHGINELLTWYFKPMICVKPLRRNILMKRRRKCAEIIYRNFQKPKKPKKVSKPKNEYSNSPSHCKPF